MGDYLKKIFFYSFLIGVWQVIFSLQIWESYLFPSPLMVVSSLTQGFRDGSFLVAILVSLKRALVGYGIALLVGIPLGLLNGKIKSLEQTMASLFSGLQALPSICWLPLSLLWFGLNEKAIVFIVVMGSIFSIAIATEAGVKNVPPIYLRAATTMGAKGIQLFRSVVVPASLPSIFTGMKLAWAFAWRSLMGGELISSGTGLGQVLMMGRDLADMSQVIAVMIIIAAIGLTIDRCVFCRMEKRMRKKWGLELETEVNLT